MSRLLRTALAFAALAATTQATAQKAPTGLSRFSHAFDRAQLDQDAKALERMTSDRLVFIDGSGKRLGKNEFIAGWMGPDTKFNPVTLIDRRVVPLGPNAGIVTAETTVTGTSGGKPFSSRIRFSDTFERIRGRWQAVHIQVTRVN